MKYLTTCLLLLLLLNTLFADETVPPVTSREAAIIQKTDVMATTNTTAAMLYLEAERSKSDHAALAFAYGNLCYTTANYIDAADAYKKALSLYPGFKAARVNLARALLQTDHPRDAVSTLRPLISSAANNPDDLLLYAHALLQARYTTSAETAFRQLLLSNPDAIEIRSGLINALLQQERYQEVLNLIKQLCETQPETAQYWTLLSNTQLALGQTTDAIVSLETARLVSRPDNQQLTQLATLYLNQGATRRAIELYNGEYVSADIPYETLYSVIETLLQHDLINDSRQLLTRWQSSHPDSCIDDAEALILYHQKRNEGAIDDAIVIATEQLHAHPLKTTWLIERSDLYRMQQQYNKAAADLQSALTSPPVRQQALRHLARNALEQKKNNEALQYLQTLQNEYPQQTTQDLIDRLKRQ
ncbi:MAG: tetratricopeptide repeat protein [Spartobacteria bacterium]|nr:tetratricopeptide repeat protein [Spartobacteria bacterium]